MRDTIFQTFTLPALPNASSCIANGTDVPVRVVIRNDAGLAVFLSTSQGVLDGATLGSSIWTMNPADKDVFVLAPRQNLYAVAAGAGAQIVVSISEALPLV